MKEVLRKLNEIDSANKDAKKLSLLRDFLRNDDLFKRVVIMATSGTLHYNIKTLPPVINNNLDYDREKTLEELFKHLDYLATVSGANKKDKEWIAKLADNLECGTVVVDRIINGKLKCGVTSTSVNKAWPGLIFDTPYMRCSTESKIDNIKYESEIDGVLVKHGAYLDEKLDGMFFNVIVENDNKVVYRSRNGKKYVVENEKLDNAFIKRSRGFNVAYTGEGRIFRNGNFLDRKTGNGIITKILKGTAKPEDHRDLVITIWEALPLKDFWAGKCEVPLEKRYNSKFFEGLTVDKGIIRIPNRVLVFSQEEALGLADEWIENGGEGGVLKNLDSIWKDGTSAYWVKLKAVVDCEMEVMGWEFGATGSKYEKCMGKIYCQSSDGLIKVKVGGGLSDELRHEPWDEHIGSIVTVRFSEMISSKTKVAKSLFLPRFIEFRDDKDTADSYEEITKLIKEAKKKSAEE
jgi:hypothetical protein